MMLKAQSAQILKSQARDRDASRPEDIVYRVPGIDIKSWVWSKGVASGALIMDLVCACCRTGSKNEDESIAMP